MQWLWILLVDKLDIEMTKSHVQIVSIPDLYSGVTKFISWSENWLSCLGFVMAVS
jgi:hypothetical protein